MRRYMRGILCSTVLSCMLAGAALAADMPLKADRFAPGPWLELFGGYVAAPDSQYGYAGAVVALNHNLRQDGWLLRIAGGDGHYSYNITPGVRNGVNFQAADIMVGYQKYYGNTLVTGYIGGNIEDHHNSADPAATVNGSRGGLKVQGEVLHPLSPAFYLYALGSYSTVWNNYFLLGKAGYNITPTISFGPEVASLGNDRFDAVRGGPFIGIKLTPSALLVVSGGYSWDTRANSLNDHSGAYGAAHVQSTF